MKRHTVRYRCIFTFGALLIYFTCGANSFGQEYSADQLAAIQNIAQHSNRFFSPDYFGMHVLDVDGKAQWPPEGSFGSIRLWDDGVTWSRIEPSPGVWSFDLLDRMVANAEAHHATILLVLGQTPTWASSAPEGKSAYNTPGSTAKPKNMDDWRQYVRTVATRYKGRIQAYEIWNEVNAQNFWSGTLADVAELEKEAYPILKSVDPSITVVSASLTNANKSTLDQYLDAGNGKYADVIGYHFYTERSTPEQMLLSILTVQNELREHGLGRKPLWNTETGWLIPENSGEFSDVRASTIWKQWKHLTPGEAVSFVPRALLLARMAGIDRFYWYGWNHQALGLTSDEGRTPRFAANSYLSVVKWLSGSRLKGCSTNGLQWSCQLGRNGKTAWIVWTVSGEAPLPDWLRKQAFAFEKLGENHPEPISNQTTIIITPMIFYAQPGDW